MLDDLVVEERKMTVEPEEVEAYLMSDDPKVTRPVDLAKVAIMDMVLRGWLNVAYDPNQFCRTAYHCMRRLPIPSVDPTLIQTLVKNWTINQGKENWVLTLACLRYAIAKIIYDLEDGVTAWTEPTSDICPVRIGQKMGILHDKVMVEPDFDVWKNADDTSMQRIMDDVKLACAIRGMLADIPSFRDEW